MTIVEYLHQGSILDQRIFYLTRKLDELKAARYSISGPQLKADRVRTSPGRDARFVRTLERMEEMEDRLIRETDTLMALKAQIEDTIHQLLRLEYQQMMCYRYLDGLSWLEISRRLHVGKTTLIRWHNTALSLLQMPENPISVQKSDIK